MTVQQPRPRIIGDEADSHIITKKTSVHGIAQHGVDVVIPTTASTPDDSEFVPMEVKWMRATWGKIRNP
jgi:hypothetical protein